MKITKALLTATIFVLISTFSILPASGNEDSGYYNVQSDEEAQPSYHDEENSYHGYDQEQQYENEEERGYVYENEPSETDENAYHNESGEPQSYHYGQEE